MGDGAARGRRATLRVRTGQPRFVATTSIDYGESLDGNVRIFEFDTAFVHAKTVVVGDSMSLVGSVNMDYRSAVDNNEVTALIIDAEFAVQLAAVFLRDLAGASEVTLAQWRQRPVQQRVMERAATLLWRWL